jgi:16S rRNA processing protein RimM
LTESSGKSPWLHLGVVSKPHGLKGGLVISLWSDRDLSHFKFIHLFPPKEKKQGSPRKLIVRSWATLPKGRWILLSNEILDRNEADKYRGYQLAVTRDMIEPLDDKEVYLADLIGCKVETEDGGDCGTVTGVIETAAPYATLVSSMEDGKELFIPLPEHNFVDHISEKNLVIVVWNGDASKPNPLEVPKGEN